jgi:hypothetical protein
MADVLWKGPSFAPATSEANGPSASSAFELTLKPPNEHPCDRLSAERRDFRHADAE